VGVLVAVIPLIVGYIVTFVDGARKDELTTVNRQIEKLYGPLYALTQANDVTWEHFSKVYWPNHSRYYFDPKQPPTLEQVAQWRMWMKTVFQPLNLQITNIIVSNSQLIVGSAMPKPFQEVIAQTESYIAIIASWSDSDSKNLESFRSPAANTVTGINYPNDLSSCVKKTYVLLKERQQRLESAFLSGLSPKAIGPIC